MGQSENSQPLLPNSEVPKEVEEIFNKIKSQQEQLPLFSEDVEGATEELLRRIIVKQEQYIALLVDECESMLPIASVHGWESQNVKAGVELRTEIRTLAKEVIPSH